MKFGWALAAVSAAISLSSSPYSLAVARPRAADSGGPGDFTETRASLEQALQAAPQDPARLEALAEYLDRYADRDTRSVYRRWLSALPASSDAARRVARRLIVLDLLEKDGAAAKTDLAAYRAAGGTGLALDAPAEPASGEPFIEIPGPLQPFARMAAISVDSSPEEVLPALARNVVTNGYQASRSSETMEPTEYMKLLLRYVSQARELDQFAGPGKVIKIEHCDSQQTGDLLRIIGFRMRGGCGSEVVLETVNAARAFLTTDSGFPTAQLEQALRTDSTFTYDFHPARVSILFGPDYWVSPRDKGTGTYLDAFLSDPTLCRFYLGLSSLDRATAEALKAAVPAPRLRAYANVLDFFGSRFDIRGGRAVVPGGSRSEGMWSELAGASVANGAQFFEKLLAKDDGWLASYFDTLARLRGPVQAYLTDPPRLRRFYFAVRGDVTSPGPARPVFRSNTEMVLLTQRLRLDPDGRPHIPGGVPLWRAFFTEHPRGKYDARIARAASGWNNPDDVLEALFGLSHKAVSNEPLKVFLSLSDVDRYRAHPLGGVTVERLAHEWRSYGPQYPIFAEASEVSDASISQFLDAAAAIDHIRDSQLRADAAGSFQALVGLWQIFRRHGSIPANAADGAFSKVVSPFIAIHDEQDVFEAGRKSVGVLLAAAGGLGDSDPQARMLELLSGDNGQGSPETRDQLIRQMQRVLDAQQAVSLTAMFAAVRNIESSASGTALDQNALRRFAARVSEIQLPQPPLSAAEKNALAGGYWTDKHVAVERKNTLRDLLTEPHPDLHAVEAALAPHLRDTLVALNYAHYAPPGAQILYTNPVFVRAHEFVNPLGIPSTWKETAFLGAGWPSNGGGRLTGSLVSLPYVLAEAEQNFLVPAKTQALIWGDLVPQILVSAKIPRWWNVTPVQLHWVDLTMRYAEARLADAAVDASHRPALLDALRVQVQPRRVALVERDLASGDVAAAIDTLTPADLYEIGAALRGNSPLESAGDPIARELASIQTDHAGEVSRDVISRAFGTPKPTLTNSYRPELLNLQTLPTVMGYSSRLMAESWQSNTLYWAALADQKHLPPAELNVAIPEWTEKVIERIFASHLEDWPALLKSLRSVGDEVKAQTSQTELARE